MLTFLTIQMILLAAFMLLFLGIHFLIGKHSKNEFLLGLGFISEFYRTITWVLTHNFEQVYFISFSNIFFSYSLFYLYIISLTRKPAKVFTKKTYLLFTPCIFDAVHKIYWLFQSREALNNYLSSDTLYFYRETFEMLSYLYGTVISFLIIVSINKRLKMTSIDFLYQTKKIIWILLGLNVFWLIDDIQVALQLPRLPAKYVHTISASFFLIIVYWIGFIILQISHFFQKSQNQRKKTEHSYILNAEKQSIYARLEAFLEKTKIYKDTNLTLTYLSEQLEVKKILLSQTIKCATGYNYYHYINNLRLKEFKTLVAEGKGKRMTIEALAEEAGFGNKVTFYNFFKKAENMTPKEYQKMVKNNLEASNLTEANSL